MNSVYSNPCTRCGKERIVVKTWREKIGYSVVTTTETACPDKECQKIVYKSNQDQKKQNRRLQVKKKNEPQS